MLHVARCKIKKRISDNERIIDQHVGLRLRLLRLREKQSQEQVGDALNLTFQQIQKYERGSNRVGASKLWRLCEYFNVEPNYFFEGLKRNVNPNQKRTVNDNWNAKLASDQNYKMVTSFSNIKSNMARRAVLQLCRSLEAANDDEESS